MLASAPRPSRPSARPAVLYQEYSDVASARELRRQQREEEGPGDEAEGAEEGPGPPRANLSPSSSFRAQRSARGSTFSLWQDIPDVRGSGVLATLSLRDCKLQEVGAGTRQGCQSRKGVLGPGGHGATEEAGPRVRGSPTEPGRDHEGTRSVGLQIAGGGLGTQQGGRGHKRAGPAGLSIRKMGTRTCQGEAGCGRGARSPGAEEPRS